MEVLSGGTCLQGGERPDDDDDDDGLKVHFGHFPSLVKFDQIGISTCGFFAMQLVALDLAVNGFLVP